MEIMLTTRDIEVKIISYAPENEAIILARISATINILKEDNINQCYITLGDEFISDELFPSISSFSIKIPCTAEIRDLRRNHFLLSDNMFNSLSALDFVKQNFKLTKLVLNNNYDILCLNTNFAGTTGMIGRSRNSVSLTNALLFVTATFGLFAVIVLNMEKEPEKLLVSMSSLGVCVLLIYSYAYSNNLESEYLLGEKTCLRNFNHLTQCFFDLDNHARFNLGGHSVHDLGDDDTIPHFGM